MKKNILFLIIGLLMTSFFYAQNEIKIGIITGTNVSRFRGNPAVEDSDSKIGFLVGISLEYYLKENLSLKTNVNYERKSLTRKSAFINDDSLRNGIEIETNFDYLILPVLMKYEFGNSSNLFVNGGGFLGYLLSSKHKSEGYPDSDSTSLNKKIDFGLSIGIGAKLDINEKNVLSVEIRDNLGLINISDVPVLDDGTIKTNSLNLILSWDFEI